MCRLITSASWKLGQPQNHCMTASEPSRLKLISSVVMEADSGTENRHCPVSVQHAWSLSILSLRNEGTPNACAAAFDAHSVRPPKNYANRGQDGNVQNGAELVGYFLGLFHDQRDSAVAEIDDASCFLTGVRDDRIGLGSRERYALPLPPFNSRRRGGRHGQWHLWRFGVGLGSWRFNARCRGCRGRRRVSSAPGFDGNHARGRAARGFQLIEP